MKNKLWIYGCSYSDNWNDRVLSHDDTWYGIIANKFNLDYKRIWDNNHCELDEATHFATGGEGWLYTQQMILRTAKNWRKNDLVIIEEPQEIEQEFLTSILTTPYMNKKKAMPKFCQQ